MNMFGLPPTNPQLSCREQLSSAITIAKLEISSHASSTIGSDCGETDKDPTSTSTTPMSNYMRRSTPTSRGDPSHFQKNILTACDINNDITQYLNNLHLSEHNKYIAQKDDLLSSCISEASAEPHYKISTTPLERSQSCRSIDTQSDNRETDLSLFSLDHSAFDTTFDQPLQPAAASFSAFGQQTEDRHNCLYTSSGSSLELDFTCKLSDSLSVSAPATTSTAYGRTYSGDNSMSSYEAHEFVSQAARYSAAAPAFIPQLSQYDDDRAYSAGHSTLLAPPAEGLQYRRPASSAVGYATASQAPLPVSRSQSHQQQQYSQQQLTRSPPLLSMQPQQQQYGQQQYGQQAGVGEAYYSHLSGGAPARAVQQLQGYATAPRYGEAPALPMPHSRSNAAAGYRPSPVPMQHAQHHYQQQHQHQASPAMGMPHLQDRIYQVQFKRGSRSFTLAPRTNFNVSVHDFVVVEGDRGEDLGIVVEVLGMQVFMERRMNMPRSAAQQDQDDQNVGCILRLATLQERQMLPDKFHTEKEIVQSCNELACYGFGLPIVVLDAELQFDRRKLTLYYDCSVRIDFRDFVRQLYATYKARIWMKKLDAQLDQQQQAEVQPFAAMALATGVQFSQGQGSSSSSNNHHHGHSLNSGY